MASNAPFLTQQLKLLIVDDSNVIRRRIERSQQIEQLQVERIDRDFLAA